MSATSKEGCRDSDADLDVDGDDTLEYGRAQYPVDGWMYGVNVCGSCWKPSADRMTTTTKRKRESLI